MTFVFDMVENILGNAENGHEKKGGGGGFDAPISSKSSQTFGFTNQLNESNETMRWKGPLPCRKFTKSKKYKTIQYEGNKQANMSIYSLQKH